MSIHIDIVVSTISERARALELYSGEKLTSPNRTGVEKVYRAAWGRTDAHTSETK